MKSILATLWAESLKVRRSKILWITIIVFFVHTYDDGSVNVCCKKSRNIQ